MTASPEPDVVTADDDSGHRGRGIRKVLRYSAVSALMVPFGQSILFVGVAVFDWPAVVANFVAVTVAAVPSYLLNRYWVWKKNDPNRLMTEVLPFWGLMVLGLLISTVLAWYAERNFDVVYAVNVANLIGFGLVWVFRYLVLDRILFRAVDQDAAKE